MVGKGRSRAATEQPQGPRGWEHMACGCSCGTDAYILLNCHSLTFQLPPEVGH